MPTRTKSLHWDSHPNLHTWDLWCDAEHINAILALDGVVSITATIEDPALRRTIMLDPRYDVSEMKDAIQAICGHAEVFQRQLRCDNWHDASWLDFPEDRLRVALGKTFLDPERRMERLHAGLTVHTTHASYRIKPKESP